MSVSICVYTFHSVFCIFLQNVDMVKALTGLRQSKASCNTRFVYMGVGMSVGHVYVYICSE